MKKQITYFLLFTFWFSTASAQWLIKHSPTTKNLYDVAFYNSQLGYAVGADGMIIKTINGGVYWQQIGAPDSTDLLSVIIVDSVTLLVSSSGNTNADGAVYRTENGGISWHKVLHQNKPMYASSAPANVIFSAGTDIYRSIDAGNNWQFQKKLKPEGNYTSVIFTADNYGIVAGRTLTDGTYITDFYRTENGGQKWYAIYQYDFPNIAAFTSMSPLNGDSVYMFARIYNGLIPTDTSQLFLLTKFHLKGLFGDTIWNYKAQLVQDNFSDQINDCKFFSNGVCYAAGEKNIIYKSNFGGKKWQKEYTGTKPINSLYMFNDEEGFAVGNNGLILQRLKTAIRGGITKVPVIFFPKPPGR